MTRRTFCTLPAAAAAFPQAAAPLGINTYCLRAWRFADAQLLDYCAKLKLDACFLQDSPDPRAMEPEHWTEVKQQATHLSLQMFTGGGSIFPKTAGDFDAMVSLLRRQTQRAAAMGSTLVRFNLAGQRSALPPGSTDFYVSTAAKVFKAAGDDLRRAGVKIALETHKDLQAWEFKLLMEEAGRDIAGIYLDTTNPLYLAEHPLTTLETLAPHVVTMHLGDACVFETPKGVYLQRVPLGQGQLPLKQLASRARELCQGITYHVKTICGRPPEPVPVHSDEFWKPMPGARSSELERFLALARGGAPFEGSMVVEDLTGRTLVEPVLSAVKEQQRTHIEKGVEYARTELHLGLRT